MRVFCYDPMTKMLYGVIRIEKSVQFVGFMVLLASGEVRLVGRCVMLVYRRAIAGYHIDCRSI
jgi:hypothetical protein